MRQRPKNFRNIYALVGQLAIFVFLSSCMSESNPLEVLGIGSNTRDGGRNAGGLSENSWQTIENAHYGRVLLQSPYLLASDPTDLTPETNLNAYLSDPVFITENPLLQESCEGDGNGVGDMTACYEVSATVNDLPLGHEYERWAFNTDTSEFLQVNTFYHLTQVNTFYHDTLRDLYSKQAQPSVDPSLNYRTSIPEKLYSTGANWNAGESFKVFADCGEPDNAYFDAESFSVCLGELSSYPTVKVANDPSVLHHEMGHALSYVQLNFRTIAQTTDFSYKADIGYFVYDEAGAINEGLSDYMAYIMDGDLDAVFEYVFGTFVSGARPIDEDHELHAAGISTAAEDRLSYPHFLTYYNDAPEMIIEDIHMAGMIASHFFVALHKDIQDTCSFEHSETSEVMYKAIMETFSLLGDLSSTGNDFKGYGNVNHSMDYDSLGVPASLVWYARVRPLTFRSFYQTFARFLAETIARDDSTLCDGKNYPRDQLEKMLDNYGLLLFNNYNEDGNHFEDGHSGTNTTITTENRLKTVLISKDLISLDDREDKSPVYIFDKRRDIKTAVEVLLAQGTITEISPQIDSEFLHNNGNGQISPGEIVGIAFNILNESNSTVAGLQVLTNDWDHVKIDDGERKPCPNLGDDWPTDSEGAADVEGEDETVSGTCGFVTRLNGNKDAQTGGDFPDAETSEYIHPVCFVQLTEDSATYWGSQDLYRDSIGLEAKDCLGGEDEPHSCFIRAIKGADAAWYSILEPNKTWGETVIDDQGSPSYNIHNMVLFEVNKETPPGTTFDCRVRARFINCSDCWEDPSRDDHDDYLDYEFSGPDPFKILHLQFTVID